MYRLHAIVDKRRHHPTHHPCPRQCADEQQYDERTRHTCHILCDSLFKARPGHIEPPHAYEHTQRRHREQRYLRRSSKRIASKSLDSGSKHRHEHNYRHERQHRRRPFLQQFTFLVSIFRHLQFVFFLFYIKPQNWSCKITTSLPSLQVIAPIP